MKALSKFILFISFFIIATICNSQTSFPRTTFTHSKSLPDGIEGNDKVGFKLSHNTLTIWDHDYKTQKDYGPLEMVSQSYKSDGLYYIRYSPQYMMKPFLGYDFIFNQKGGNLIGVIEINPNNNTSKYYFKKERIDTQTEKSIGSKESQEILIKLLFNSSTSKEIADKVEFAFEKTSNKELLENNTAYNVGYEFDKLTKIDIVYNLDNSVRFIKIYAPKRIVQVIEGKLIKKYLLSGRQDGMNEIKTKTLKILSGTAGVVGLILVEDLK